jgi:hypothetical protein
MVYSWHQLQNIQRPILHQKKLDGYNPLHANRWSVIVVRLEDRACVGRVSDTKLIVRVCVLVKLVPRVIK